MGIAIREQLPMSGLPAFFSGAFPELERHAAAAGISLSGPPFARYISVSPELVDVEAVFPIDAPVEGGGRVQAIQLEAGPAVQVLHKGPYEELHTAYAVIEQWLQDHGTAPSGPVREIYLTGPDVAPAEHQTLIVQPISKSGAA